MLLSDVNWDAEVQIHDVIRMRGIPGYGTGPRLMWRGYGRFTNLDSGSEWFIEDSHLEFEDWVLET